MHKTVLLFATALVFVLVALWSRARAPDPEVEPAERPRTEARRPRAVALVLDRSGSMEGTRMEALRRAAESFIETLHPQDRIALITYGSSARVDLPAVPVGTNRTRVVRILDDIREGGGSHLSAGLSAGFRSLAHLTAPWSKQVVLVTDGGANQGLTEPHLLETLVTTARGQGATLETVGLGGQHDENLLARLALLGGGRYLTAAHEPNLNARLLELAQERR